MKEEKSKKNNKKNNKKKIIIITVSSILAVLLIILIFCFSKKQDNSKEKVHSHLNGNVSIGDNSTIVQEPSKEIDTILTQLVSNDKNDKLKYRLYIPENFRFQKDLNMNIPGTGVEYVFYPLNKHMLLDEKSTFDINNKIYANDNKQCLLIVSEYTGTVEYPYGAQNGEKEKDRVDEIITWIVKNTISEHLGTKPFFHVGTLKEILKTNPETNKKTVDAWRYYSDYTTAETGHAQKKYFKGILKLNGNCPLFVWCLDLSEDNRYSSEIDNLILNIEKTVVIEN